jgi:hypothetical protein
MKNTVPKHRRPNSLEMQAALRVSKEFSEAFAAHGIYTPHPFLNLGIIADLIAGVEPARPRKLTPEEEADIDSLIGN